MDISVSRIFHLAKQKGISTAFLNTLINAYPGKIEKWKQGSLAPSYHELTAIANFFNVPIDYLLGNVNDPSPIARAVPDNGTEKKLPAKAGSYICIVERTGAERRIPVSDDKLDCLVRLLEAGLPELFE